MRAVLSRTLSLAKIEDMKNPSQLLPTILVTAVFFAACSADKKDTVYTSGKTTNNTSQSNKQADLTVIDENVPTGERGSISQPKRGNYNSETVTMIDGAGNKVEQRCFQGHSRVNCVILRTTVHGEKSLQISAKNGELVNLPADKFEMGLSGTPNEIADAANISEPLPPQMREPLTAPASPIPATETAVPQVSPQTTAVKPPPTEESPDTVQPETEKKDSTLPKSN